MSSASSPLAPAGRRRKFEPPRGAESDFTDSAIVENADQARAILSQMLSRIAYGIPRGGLRRDLRRAASLLDMALVGLDQSSEVSHDD